MSGTRKTVLIILGTFGALILVAIIGIAILWTSLRRGEPSIRDNSLLTLRVSGSPISRSPVS
jgi:hypothetical protein